jgi:VanZ family protein
LVGYLVGIFLLSSIRGTKVPLGSLVLFKVKVTNILHVPVFAILFLLIFMVLKAWTSMSRKWGCIVALLATSVLGVVVELYQAGVPGRAASWVDVILNLVGVGFGLLIFWLVGYTR